MTAQELFQSWAESGALVLCRHDFQRSGLSYSAVFAPNMVSEIGRKIYEAGYFLEDISVMQVKEGFLATYHYTSAAEPGLRLAIRALSPKGVFTSLATVYQGAEWHEREATDFFGVQFIANPNPVPLLLPHDFPDPPPLLKDDKNLASLTALKLFGQARVLDQAWLPLVGAEALKEGAEA